MKENSNNKISPSLQLVFDNSKLAEMNGKLIHFTYYILLPIKINLVSMLFFSQGWLVPNLSGVAPK